MNRININSNLDTEPVPARYGEIELDLYVVSLRLDNETVRRAHNDPDMPDDIPLGISVEVVLKGFIPAS